MRWTWSDKAYKSRWEREKKTPVDLFYGAGVRRMNNEWHLFGIWQKHIGTLKLKRYATATNLLRMMIIGSNVCYLLNVCKWRQFVRTQKLFAYTFFFFLLLLHSFQLKSLVTNTRLRLWDSDGSGVFLWFLFIRKQAPRFIFILLSTHLMHFWFREHCVFSDGGQTIYEEFTVFKRKWTPHHEDYLNMNARLVLETLEISSLKYCLELCSTTSR